MKRSKTMWHRILRSSVSVFSGVISLVACADEKPRPPNVIVIFADDMGYADVAIQGQLTDLQTPNLDLLGREGVRCTAGYCSAPQCVPSRAGLITGRHQQRFGIDSNLDCPL